MKVIRNSSEDLSEMIRELKIGDMPIYDTVSQYEITKVPGGYIYKNEYCGLVFVPEAEKPRTMAEKKVEKPARRVVTK